MTPITDTGLLDYLVENIRCYQGKYQEDGSMLVVPLISDKIHDYGYCPSKKYIDGSDINGQLIYDYFAQIPTIYYRSTEITPDRFLMKFSIYPFPGCHQVFGENRLISTFASHLIIDDELNINGIYGQSSGSGIGMTQTEFDIALKNRGEQYSDIYPEEFGVLIFLNIFLKRGLTNVGGYNDGQFLYFQSLLISGLDAQEDVYISTIKIENQIATITHLDGMTETFQLPNLYSVLNFKMYIGEYLSLIPKEANGPFGEYTWINKTATSFCIGGIRPEEVFQTSIDKNNSTFHHKYHVMRLCFTGDIVETLDVEHFKSLPIIN